MGGNAQLLADLVSVFTTQGTFAVYGNFNNSASVYNVSIAASALLQGVELGMAPGEVPVSIVTPNLQLIIRSTLIFASSKIVLSTPATASQLASGSIQPKVTLGARGLQDCYAVSQYVYLSVLQWSINPYENSSAVQTPMFRLACCVHFGSINPYAYSTEVQTPTRRLAYSEQAVESDVQSYSRELSQSSASYDLPGTLAYYVTLQFATVMNLDFSAEKTGGNNYSVPACSYYDGGEYVDCDGCTISSYSNYNVTYGCYNIFKLCPASAGRRRLAEEQRSVSLPYILPYGVLIESVGAEFYNVLSSNPFKLDLTVITFMGSLCGGIIAILIYLLRKDHTEKLYKRYVKSEAANLARKLLKDEIKKGSNGDIGKSFQTQVKSLHLSIKSVKTFSSRLSHTLSGKVDHRCRHRGATFLGVNFDFDEIESNEFDSDCGDDNSSDEGEESNFDFVNIYSGGNSVKISEKVYSKVGIILNSEEAKLAEQFGTAAVVTEFLFKLFPGRSIFIKEKNLLGIMCVQHKYISMFAASTVTQTRTIRFFNVLSFVLTSIFADTVFFGIFYPVHSACTSKHDKVSR